MMNKEEKFSSELESKDLKKISGGKSDRKDKIFRSTKKDDEKVDNILLEGPLKYFHGP